MRVHDRTGAASPPAPRRASLGAALLIALCGAAAVCAASPLGADVVQRVAGLTPAPLLRGMALAAPAVVPSPAPPRTGGAVASIASSAAAVPAVVPAPTPTLPPLTGGADAAMAPSAAAAAVHAVCNATALLAAARARTLRWHAHDGTLAVDAASAHCDPEALAGAHAAVLDALAGEHLVLVGDSLTRYQYLSLVYFLETRRWASPPGAPVNTNEKSWSNWTEFHTGMTARLRGHEICDCYRGPTMDGGIREMRYYTSACGRVRVSYVMWWWPAQLAGQDRKSVV